MDSATRIEAEWQCRNLSYEFGYFIDQGLYSRVAELFTVDGVFHRHGQVLSGRDAIVEALKTRPTDRISRNVSGNIVFAELTAELARAVVYINVFLGRLDPQGKPTPYEGSLFECRDLYRRTSDGWRIAERIALKIFVTAKSSNP